MNTSPLRHAAPVWHRVARLVSIALIVASIASAIGIGRSPANAHAWTVEVTLGTLQLALLAAGVILLLLGRHLLARDRARACGTRP